MISRSDSLSEEEVPSLDLSSGWSSEECEDAVEATSVCEQPEENSLYSDAMNLRNLNADNARLERFVEKSVENEAISFVELYQAFDVGAKFNDFFERAAVGRAELVADESMPQHRRMAVEAFNRSEPKLQVQFLKEVLGENMAKAATLMLLHHNVAMRDIMGIRYHLADRLKDVGDVMDAKNKERYEIVASMPAYSTVIAARRAEVEVMLDAGNQKEYLATQRM